MGAAFFVPDILYAKCIIFIEQTYHTMQFFGNLIWETINFGSAFFIISVLFCVMFKIPGTSDKITWEAHFHESLSTTQSRKRFSSRYNHSFEYYRKGIGNEKWLQKWNEGFLSPNKE